MAEAPRRRLLLTADAVGGVWHYAAELAAALPAHGIDPVIALLGPSPSPDQRALLPAGVPLIETGLPLDWLCDRPGPIEAAGVAIAAVAAAHGSDLVQLNMPSLGAARFAMPVVAVNHGCAASWWEAAFGAALPPERAWQATLTASGLANAAAVVTPTRAFADTTARLYGLADRPRTVHNGRHPLVERRRAAMHDFAFTAGRLWDQVKNLDLLDRVAARLAIPFYAAGPLTGPHGQSFAPAHLKPSGYLSEAALAETLSRRPVFVSAARFEPFGLAVLEAAAAGCPLVLSDLPGFRELWDGAAIFVDREDEDGFVEAVTAIVGDEAARIRLGEAAAARAVRYTPGATAAGMAAVYAEVGASARAAA